MGKVSNEPINSKSKEPAISKTSIQKDQAKAKEAKPNDHELKIDTYMKSFHDPTYKFQKFNPKKKCSRCEQLNAFSCEHNVVVRESILMNKAERGKFYTAPVKGRDAANNTSNSGSYNYASHANSAKDEEERLAKLNRERMKKLGKPESLIQANINVAKETVKSTSK